MIDKKKYIQDALEEDYFSDEQIEMLYNIINLRRGTNIHKLLEISGCDVDNMNYDTAYPQPYADKIRDLYPDFTNGRYIFDYTNNVFGKLVNINNIFAKQIFNVFVP